MKFDVNLGDVPLRRVPELSRQAESLGVNGAWVSEITHSPFNAMTLMAESTEHLTFGSGIALAFPRSPMVTAYSAWDLQGLSGGRLELGLGTQVKGHIVRRFSMEWDSPGPRFRDYVRCLRHIWDAWASGRDVDYTGDFYEITLCPPMFTPSPVDDPDIPLYIAGVNPYNIETAGMLCDGLHVHPFHSPKFVEEEILPHLRSGAEEAGRDVDEIELVTPVFAIGGDNESERAALREEIRHQIAFYGSTRTYRKVFETHGWGGVCDELHELSVNDRWEQMSEAITDEMMRTFTVEGSWREIPGLIEDRYSHVDRVSIYKDFRGEDFWETLLV